MSKPIGIGSQGWRRADRRVYAKRDGGGPLPRGQWERVWIVGETRRSWVCSTVRGVKPDNRCTFKIPKSGESGVFFDGRDVELQIWASEHGHQIAQRVSHLSRQQLRDVATAIGYEIMPSEPTPDGQPWLIDRSEGGWGTTPVRLLDIDGREVNRDGRPITSTETP